MAGHNELGKQGEKLAAEWLASKGYWIIERNWKIGHVEIDIIAQKGEWLHFIEVKTRSSECWGGPEESVDHRKLSNWRRAAQGYLCYRTGYRWIQYDIIAVIVPKKGVPIFTIFEDV